MSGLFLAVATAGAVFLYPPAGASGSGGAAHPNVEAARAQAQSVSRNDTSRMSQTERRRAALAQQFNSPSNPAVEKTRQERYRALAAQEKLLRKQIAKVTKEQRENEIKEVITRRKAQEDARTANGGICPAGLLSGPVTAYKVFADQEDLHFSQPLKPGTFSWSSAYGATGFWLPYHQGQDFAAVFGTPVYAVTDSVIGHPTSEWWAGTHVVTYHADGSSLIYAHLQSSTVKPGQVVKSGDLIGYVGSTGRSFGAHLHLEYYPPNTVPGQSLAAVDPMAWLRGNGLVIR